VQIVIKYLTSCERADIDVKHTFLSVDSSKQVIEQLSSVYLS